MAASANGTTSLASKTVDVNVVGNGPLKDKDYDGWMCGKDTKYHKYIKALSQANPGLKRPDPANEVRTSRPVSSLTNRKARVVLLEAKATASGETKFVRHNVPFEHGSKLGEHFAGVNHSHDSKRIYLMEGLTRDFIDTVGGHFSIDPAVFLRQERTTPWSNDFTPASDALPPPTSLDPEKTFLVQYCELRQFNKSMKNVAFFCEQTGRHVGMTAARTKQETTTAILRRKVSWWSRKTKGEKGWDVVILCDPPLGKLRKWQDPKGSTPLKSRPFRDGYVDFLPTPLPEEAESVPTNDHKSMLEDLCYYFENHSQLLDDTAWKEPGTSSIFLKKIVAAHYLQLIDYIKAMLPSLELKLATVWTDEEEQWKNLQTISRRCGNYQDDVEDALLSFGYPVEGLQLEYCNSTQQIGRQQRTRHDWKDCYADFQYIHFRLKVLKHRTDTLMQSMTGLASIAGNRQNLSEAKRINLVGLGIIPLTFTATIFSMSDDFLPGSAKFWVYWACGIGAVAATVILIKIWDHVLDKSRWTKGLDQLKSWKPEGMTPKSENPLKKAETGTFY